MSVTERIVVAVCIGLMSAGLSAAASLALGLAHVWPGTVVSFGFATFLHLTVSRRWQR